MLTPDQRREKIGGIFRVAGGNFLEQYDFFVYGYYAVYIGHTFFPSDSDFASLMASLATFGVGFLMRPIGGLLLGSYIDRHGRRRGLLLTLGLMAIGTLSIAVTPGYASIGIAAPILIVIGRLLQGFSAGVELGGVSVYLAEIATPGNRGFYTAWQSASQQIAVIFAALLGFALNLLMPADEMAAWGWRIPMLVGCMIVPLIFILRRSLQETAAYQAQKHKPTAAEVLRLIVENWKPVLLGAMLSCLTTTTFYMITAYTPTYGREVLHLATSGVLLVTICVGISNFIWLPIGGAISDRMGRKPVLIALSLIAIITAYPAMSWLDAAPSFTRLLAVLLWFSFIFGVYNGGAIPFLTEMMPFRVRTAGFSLAFSLATALFGGATPAMSTWLIHETGNRAMPAVWLSIAAVLGLIAALLARHDPNSEAPVETDAAH